MVAVAVGLTISTARMTHELRPCDDAGRVGPLRRTAMGLGRVTMRAGHGRVTTLMLCLFEPRPPCAAPD